MGVTINSCQMFNGECFTQVPLQSDTFSPRHNPCRCSTEKDPSTSTSFGPIGYLLKVIQKLLRNALCQLSL